MYTNNTERLRIGGSGNMGLGTVLVFLSLVQIQVVLLLKMLVSNTGIKIGDGANDNYLVAAGNGSFYLSHYGSASMILELEAAATSGRIDRLGHLGLGVIPRTGVQQLLKQSKNWCWRCYFKSKYLIGFFELTTNA